MSLRILVAPDSFGGALDSVGVADAIAAGWSSVRPDDEIVRRPMADGGEGTLAALAAALGDQAERRQVSTVDPLGRPIDADWLALDDGRGAFVEMAAASGLARLAPDERSADSVRHASTRGTGDLVRAALDAGVVVSVLPGASAVETALVASGLVSERYAFVGFLPRRAAERTALWEELAGWRWPIVAFESPQRLGASLRSLAAVTPERDVVVCRELTKRFEEVVRGTASSLADRYAEPPKGEITLVLGPAEPAPPSEEAAGAAVAELVAAGTPRKVAVEVVSRLTDMPRNVLYRGSL